MGRFGGLVPLCSEQGDYSRKPHPTHQVGPPVSRSLPGRFTSVPGLSALEVPQATRFDRETEVLPHATSQHAFSGCMFANAHVGTMTSPPILAEQPLGFVSAERNLCLVQRARYLTGISHPPDGRSHCASVHAPSASSLSYL